MTNQSTITRPVESAERVPNSKPNILRWTLVVGLVVAVAITGLVAYNVITDDAAGLTRVQQAEADRLQGVADSMTTPLTRAQQAEADRLSGMAEAWVAEHLTRAQQADADRLQGLGDYYTTQHLTRAQQAEAARLQGLADYYANGG
jgi:predicted DNA repair protein MutK